MIKRYLFRNEIYDNTKLSFTGTSANSAVVNGSVVNGFSNTCYISLVETKILKDKSWKVIGSVLIPEGTLTGYKVIWSVSDKASTLRGAIVLNGDKLEFQAVCGDSQNPTASGTKISLPTSGAGWIHYQLKYNNETGNYALYYRYRDKDYSQSGSYTPTTTNKQMYEIVNASDEVMQLLGYGADGGNWTSSMDMHYSKVYVEERVIKSYNNTKTYELKHDSKGYEFLVEVN